MQPLKTSPFCAEPEAVDSGISGNVECRWPDWQESRQGQRDQE